jgi:hypothetical protein
VGLCLIISISKIAPGAVSHRLGCSRSDYLLTGKVARYDALSGKQGGKIHTFGIRRQIPQPHSPHHGSLLIQNPISRFGNFQSQPRQNNLVRVSRTSRSRFRERISVCREQDLGSLLRTLGSARLTLPYPLHLKPAISGSESQKRMSQAHLRCCESLYTVYGER